MNYARKHFYPAHYCLVPPHKFTNILITYLLTLYFVVFLIPIILKILLHNINDKRLTNYEMRCELGTVFCSKFPEQWNTLRCLFLKKK